MDTKGTDQGQSTPPKTPDSSTSSTGPKTDRPQQTQFLTTPHAGHVVALAQTTEVSFSGPLPPPDALAGYGRIDPTFPERIVRLAEEEAQHRRRSETVALDAEANDARAARVERRIGQVLGFVLAVLFLIAGVWLTLAGHPTVGAVVLGTTMVSLVTVFVVGRRGGSEAPPPSEPAPTQSPSGGQSGVS
jgi:uncharacterized membrane protein